MALLRALRPGIEAVEIRGNVDTRLRKVAAGEYDGALLAAAGLERLGRLDEATQIFEAMEFLAVARPGDDRAPVPRRRRTDACSPRSDRRPADASRRRGGARASSTELGAGCALPVGAYAQIADGLLAVRGMIAGEDGEAPVFGDATGPPKEDASLGRGLARRLLEARGMPAVETGGATR